MPKQPFDPDRQLWPDDHIQAYDENVPAWSPFELFDTVGNCEIYGNSRYTVLKRTHRPAGPHSGPYLVHLSIHDHARSARHDWRDLQRIKNELIGSEEQAVEFYPPESKLADTANEYHLFSFLGVVIPVGFDRRLVSEVSTIGSADRARQRPWRDEDRPTDLTVLTNEHVEPLAEDLTIPVELSLTEERTDGE